MKSIKDWTEDMENTIGGSSLKSLGPIITQIRAEVISEYQRVLGEAEKALRLVIACDNTPLRQIIKSPRGVAQAALAEIAKFKQDVGV